MLRNKGLRIDNRLKSLPFLAIGIPRFCSVIDLWSMGGNMPVFENIEVNENKIKRWNMYYQCKADYDNITSNIESLELLNKNWVRIPTLNMASAFNVDLGQSSVSKFCYGQAITGKFGMGDRLSDTAEEEQITPQGLANESGEIYKIDGTVAGVGCDTIDKDISSEDERMDRLFRKGYGRSMDIADILNTDLNDTEARSYKRFYEYIDGVSDGNNMQVHEIERKVEDPQKDLVNKGKNVLEAKGGRLIPPETPESAQISELEDLEPPIGVFNLNDLNTSKPQSETTKFEVSVSVGKIEAVKDVESEPEEQQVALKKRKDNTKSVLRKLTKANDGSSTELIEPVLVPVQFNLIGSHTDDDKREDGKKWKWNRSE